MFAFKMYYYEIWSFNYLILKYIAAFNFQFFKKIYLTKKLVGEKKF